MLDLNSLFRYPAAVIVLFLAIVFFGLVMLDIVTLSLPSAVAGRQSAHSGLAGSVGMGFFAGVLSTPCSGALLGFVLVWAQTQPLLVSSTAIVLMGVGMALPYAIIVLIPSLLDRIPKPGYWMEIFKKSTGFLLFLIAVKLTLAALPKDRLLNVLMYGIVFSFCVWMWGKWVDFSTPALRRTDDSTDRRGHWPSGPGCGCCRRRGGRPEAALDWKPYDADVVQQAVAQQQPVLLKFTADWCTNCKVVERRVYQDPDVVQTHPRPKTCCRSRPIRRSSTIRPRGTSRPSTARRATCRSTSSYCRMGPSQKLRGIFDKERVDPDSRRSYRRPQADGREEEVRPDLKPDKPPRRRRTFDKAAAAERVRTDFADPEEDLSERQHRPALRRIRWSC